MKFQIFLIELCNLFERGYNLLLIDFLFRFIVNRLIEFLRNVL